MAVAKTVWGFIENRDQRVMRRVNSWSAPRWIRFWMLTATRMGDGWLWYSLGALLLAFGGSRGYVAFGAAGAAAIFGHSCFQGSEELESSPAALPVSAALLGEGACRPTSFPFRRATR